MKWGVIKQSGAVLIGILCLSGCGPVPDGKVVVIPNNSPRPAALSGFHLVWFKDSLQKVREEWDPKHEKWSVRLSKFVQNGNVKVYKYEEGQKTISFKSFDALSGTLTESDVPAKEGLRQKIATLLPVTDTGNIVEGEKMLGFNGEDWLLEVWSNGSRLQVHRWYPGNELYNSDWVYNIGSLLSED